MEIRGYDKRPLFILSLEFGNSIAFPVNVIDERCGSNIDRALLLLSLEPLESSLARLDQTKLN